MTPAATIKPTHTGGASFGIDAPGVPIGLGTATAVCVAAATAVPHIRRWPWLRACAWTVAASCTVTLANYLHTTLRGKFQVWEDEFDQLALRGDETIVDLGCGRGAVLLAAAARLPRGRAIGVDLWRTVDQSGNHPEMTMANAPALGVADRVELLTADLRELPLPNASADVVLSSLAVHNLHHPRARDSALREAARILRPGGRFVLLDLAHVPRHAQLLTDAGLVDVHHRNAGWRLWLFGGAGARILTATRPG